MKQTILLLGVLSFLGITFGAYVNPYELDSHFKEGQKVDREIEQLEYNAQRAKTLSQGFRASYNSCKARNVQCMHSAYAIARGNENFIEESKSKLEQLRLKQILVWKSFLDCKEGKDKCGKKPVVASNSVTIQGVGAYASKIASYALTQCMKRVGVFGGARGCKKLVQTFDAENGMRDYKATYTNGNGTVDTGICQLNSGVPRHRKFLNNGGRNSPYLQVDHCIGERIRAKNSGQPIIYGNGVGMPRYAYFSIHERAGNVIFH